MRFLLDTHAFVWGLVSPERLSATARTAMTDPSADLLVSSVTGWEIATKVRAGKWPEAAATPPDLAMSLRQLRATTVDLTLDDGLAAGRLEWAHADPFDRMLVAQALSRGLMIITMDPAITAHPVPTLW